jgi:hypothetical protein
MKSVVATALLVAAIASPALAQQQTPAPMDRPVVQQPSETVGQGAGHENQSPVPRGTGVYDSKGNRQGADPDPRVRDEIKRDPPSDKAPNSR